MNYGNVRVLRNLIEMAVESKSLYVAAVGFAGERDLKSGLWRVADARNELIDRLACHAPARPARHAPGDVTDGGLHAMYLDAMESFRRHVEPDAGDLRLREYERRFLDCLERAAETVECPEIRATLLEQLPKLRASNRELGGVSNSFAA